MWRPPRRCTKRPLREGAALPATSRCRRVWLRTDKLSRMAALPRELAPTATRAASVCPLDCPDACSLEVQLEDGRAVAIAGTRVNPLTDGYICAKVRRFPEHLYGPDRIRYPQVRIGEKGKGQFRRVSWEEALDLVARRMKELVDRGQGERILPSCYGGSN